VKSLGRLEAGVAVLMLVAMAVLPLIEIAGRKFLGGGIPGSIPMVQHLTLWITFLGAALAAKNGRMLALSTAEFVPERWRETLKGATNACGSAVAVWLAIASVPLVQVERESGYQVAWGIPVWVAAAIIPIGFVFIAWRLVSRWPLRLLALALPLVFVVWPDLAATRMMPVAASAVLVAAALGMPIFAVLGGLALVFFWAEGVPTTSVPAEAYRLASSPLLPAIPLFTLGGYLLSEGGASRRLMRALTALVGWMPGGLAIMVTLLLAFFTPFTGASGVTILSLGGLLLPMLTKGGYDEDTSVGLVTVAGSIGLLLPPSLPVILYGIYAHTAIDVLFVRALIPGLVLVAAVAGWAAWRGRSANAERAPFDPREAARAVWGAKWELLLPVVVLAGLLGGFATLVEAAALTVLYALVVECFVHKDLKIRTDLPRIAIECSTVAGAFLIILAVALGLTNYLIHAEVPMRTLEWMRAHVQSQVVFLLMLNLFLLVAGALMDIYSAILILVPLLVPVAAAYGIDPARLGIIFLANMELGYLTPPMGENLFLSSFRFKMPITRIYACCLPYCVMLLIVVLLITYLPGLSAVSVE
jgi:C4-dicarboxylate transporter, DctM subunit